MPAENSPIIALLVVALACASFTNAYPGDSSSPVTRGFYRESQAFLNTSGNVRHIEADIYRNGSLLFADGYSLKTTNGVTTELVVGHPTILGYVEGTAGSARFHRIPDFWQVNSTHVLLVDYFNHCIRLVNRVSKSTSTFAGRCRSSGNTNSRGSSARFYYPRSIIANKNDNRSVIITQGSRTRYAYLRSINLDTRYVTTLLTSGLKSPDGMAWSENGDSLYVTNYHYIAHINWSTKAVTRLAGSTSSGSQNGQFSQARFFYPKEMVALDEDVIVLADTSNKQLKFLNTDEKVVSPICDSYNNNHTFRLSPLSIAHINGDFYVGFSQRIVKLSGYGCQAEETVYVPPYKQHANVIIDSRGHSAELPPGRFRFNVRVGSCNSYILTVLNSTVVRRASLKAEYAINCSLLTGNNLGKMLLEPVLSHKMHDFGDICRSDCKMSDTVRPTYTCDNSVLTVIWPTDTVYAQNVDEVSRDLYNLLKERLQSAGVQKAEMIVLNKQSPLVLPRIGSDGQSVQVFLNSTCLEEGASYQPRTDTCTSPA